MGTQEPKTKQEVAEYVLAKRCRIAEIAKKLPEERLVSLAHHIDLWWMNEAFRGTPIGIPTFEDKVLQRAVVMVLEPIYEQSFYNFSFGFRPGRSQHQTLRKLREGLWENKGGWVIDLDIRKFFDTLDHGKLREILAKRIGDGVIRKLIDKWLKAGVMENGEVSYNDEGTPQGGVISPLLSNIYLHEVLDEWFVKIVQPRMQGKGFMVRFADDAVLGFETKADAERVMAVLPKRFEKYGLMVHPEKTKLIDMRKTDPSRLARSLENRHISLREQQAKLCSKLRGHYSYYGVTSNFRSLKLFFNEVMKGWRKWLARRSRSGTLSWEKFIELVKRYPLPSPRIVHSNV